jgi:hypothetical protein
VRVSSTRFCAPGSRRLSDQIRRPQGGVVPWQPLGVRASLFAADRRAVIKARVVHHQGRSFRSAPLSAHVAYLERDGVTRDGEKGCMSGATGERTDAMGFARCGLNDRHHFRFIATPEDAAEMTDLKAFTRDLVTSPARWRPISAPGWGLASPIGTPTPAFASRGTWRRR